MIFSLFFFRSKKPQFAAARFFLMEPIRHLDWLPHFRIIFQFPSWFQRIWRDLWTLWILWIISCCCSIDVIISNESNLIEIDCWIGWWWFIWQNAGLLLVLWVVSRRETWLERWSSATILSPRVVTWSPPSPLSIYESQNRFRPAPLTSYFMLFSSPKSDSHKKWEAAVLSAPIWSSCCHSNEFNSPLYSELYSLKR